MKNFMKNFVGMFMTERHYLILDERDFMDVLDVVNDQFMFDQFKNDNLKIGRIGQKKWCDLSSTKMYMHFDATEKQWVAIMRELGNQGFRMDIYSDDPENVHLTKKAES